MSAGLEAKFSPTGLKFERTFSTEGVSPFDQVKWEKRKASITDDKGAIIFEQEGVEVPEFWSMLATNVVSSKYLYGDPNNAKEREYSVRQLVNRVTRTISDWGMQQEYFASQEDADNFYNELTWLCLNQYGAFNSPVWFNVGLYHQNGVNKESIGNYFVDLDTKEVKRASTQYEHPQASACFIQKVDDTMESIMALANSEAMLFKFGSGTGTDLSTIRSARESMSGGGKPSGPLSFLRIYDAIARVVKSGGKTRRAAKMNTLKDWHPDIKEFIEAKPAEERKAWALIDGGYSGDFNGEAYDTVSFQNENLSVRLTDEFMKAVEENRDWTTHWVTDPKKEGPTYKARDILNWIAEGTWLCGDPGVQYEDTIQRMHTVSNTAPINSSNPCSEYMFLDDTACNLASLNLMKFANEDGSFNIDRFKKAAGIFITAQEILVSNASYPTESIARNSDIYRTLGLGYANLGAFLMSQGLSYDSEGGRQTAKAITAIMHTQAYVQSARLAGVKGAFEDFERNREPMMAVLEEHRRATEDIDEEKIPEHLRNLSLEARLTGEQAVELGKENGYRNAQVTVLAPTGTIGFMMDCDTTGVEPDIAVVKYKLLAGGGMLKIVNKTVKPALERLGYSPEETNKIIDFINEKDTIEGAPGLKEEDLEIFDCAFKPRNGKRFIPYTGHIKMMAAVQPHLSGAISKTVNMPNEATTEQIAETYIQGWKSGLKALAIYRDGCKRSQPVNTGKSEEKREVKDGKLEEKTGPIRRRMPATRESITHKFDIAGHEGYITVGKYDDGTPGEMFITMAKEGSTVGGLMDAFGTSISMCLQYGVPIKSLVEKFSHQRFEPSGFTKNPEIPIAKSLPDYIFRWFGQTFMGREENNKTVEDSPKPILVGENGLEKDQEKDQEKEEKKKEAFVNEIDAPTCPTCGTVMIRDGKCHSCPTCGKSGGCSE